MSHKPKVHLTTKKGQACGEIKVSRHTVNPFLVTCQECLTTTALFDAEILWVRNKGKQHQ